MHAKALSSMSFDSTQPAISVRDISKKYVRGEHVVPFHKKRNDVSSFYALKNVSFNVERGEVLGVIGRNGAGKSTLLRLIAGLGAPTSGSIVRNGDVGLMLGLGLGMHSEMTGRENIRMSGRLLGMTRKEIQEREGDIIAFSELKESMDTPVKFYSAGMRSRLSFAIVMHLSHPDIVLIDEALAAGDHAFRQKAYDAIRSFAETDRTVVIASHGIGRLEAIADRCLLLQNGQIAAIGDPTDVVEMYVQNSSLLPCI